MRGYDYYKSNILIVSLVTIIFIVIFSSATVVATAKVMPPGLTQNSVPASDQGKTIGIKAAAAALLYNSTGRLRTYNESITYYDKALAINPNDIGALTGKGLAIGGLGKDNESILYYDKALAIDPKDIGALASKGLALGKLGKYNEAIAYYDKALAIDPTYTAAIKEKEWFVAAHHMNSANTNSTSTNSTKKH